MKDGTILTFGWNSFKQLGHSFDQDIVWEPRKIENVTGVVGMASVSIYF